MKAGPSRRKAKKALTVATALTVVTAGAAGLLPATAAYAASGGWKVKITMGAAVYSGQARRASVALAAKLSPEKGVLKMVLSGPAEPGSSVFVPCMGRSGSTLLRFVLDSHPELACPPETSLPALCSQLPAACWRLESLRKHARYSIVGLFWSILG